MAKHTQTICWQQPKTFLSGFDHFVRLALTGWRLPYRHYRSHKIGSILVYVRSLLPPRKLECPNIRFGIQAIPFDINREKEKWLVVALYRPRSELMQCFLDSLTKTLNLFYCCYDR